jgi:flagellar biosynthesis protein FlhA
MLLAINTSGNPGTLRGIQTREPTTGASATWIESGLREQAQRAGYSVVEPVGVLANHLIETVRKHADEILTRDATKHLIDELKRSSPATVEELIPGQMKLSAVQRILQLLLREQVPIRQLGAILESLGEFAGNTNDPAVLTEYVRQRLARAICARYADTDGKLWVVTLAAELEEEIKSGVEITESGAAVRLPPLAIENVCQSLADAVAKLARENHPPIVLVSPQIRAALKQLTASQLPRLIVLSYAEITRDTSIECVATAGYAHEALAMSR